MTEMMSNWLKGDSFNKKDEYYTPKVLVEPILNDEQIKDMKPQIAGAITTAVMAYSLGVSQEDIGKQAQELVNKQEEQLKKN